MAILEARNLTVTIPTEDGEVNALRNASFSVESGSLFGIAGESGSGKSVMMQAVLGLLPNAHISGEVIFEGEDLLKQPAKALQKLRGARIGMIFQDPLSSLHPYYTIGKQITEAIRVHRAMTSAEARALAVDMLEKVGIERADERFDAYPHQFSGGMRQRVMIAMALVLRPPLIIADEPTTALDVTVQAQIIDLLDQMREELGTTVIMITHDLALLSSVANKIMVMYAGHRMEYGPSSAVFKSPVHPYTIGLLRSSPSNYEAGQRLEAIPGRPPSLLGEINGCPFADRCAKAMPQCEVEKPPIRLYSDATESLCWLESPASEEASAPVALAQKQRLRQDPIVAVENVELSYGNSGAFRKRTSNKVLRGINLEVYRGETLGLVGESGCGKSTLARVIAGLVHPDNGYVLLNGMNTTALSGAEWKQLRRSVQLVFQDPFGSLNPRRRVGAIIGEPFRVQGLASGKERLRQVQELMDMVGLNPEHYNRFPSEFSGGQRQRVGIARALALKPELIIFDEPVSALDVSIQAQILNLMADLQRSLQLTYLFISHDLSVVRQICDRIAVMNGGEIVELENSEAIYERPSHAYTRTLLSAMAKPPALEAAPGRTLVATSNWSMS